MIDATISSKVLLSICFGRLLQWKTRIILFDWLLNIEEPIEQGGFLGWIETSQPRGTLMCSLYLSLKHDLPRGDEIIISD